MDPNASEGGLHRRSASDRSVMSGPAAGLPSVVARRVRCEAAVVLALAACACHGAPLPPLTPQVVSIAPYPQGREAMVADPATQQPIYRAVLRFFRPGPGQSRWLDRRLLPATAGDTGRVLDAALTDRLVAAFGKGSFCVLGSSACTHRRGGVVRMSLPYSTGPDVARVIVRFDGLAGPYAPGTAFSATEVFLLVRAGGRWRIHTHESAGAGPSGHPED